MNILVVHAAEDERENLREMLTALRPDAELRLFDSGLTALADARKQEADIAVIDTALPELSGIDFGRYLQELYPSVNLIYLSSDRELGFEALRQHAAQPLLLVFPEGGTRTHKAVCYFFDYISHRWILLSLRQ